MKGSKPLKVGNLSNNLNVIYFIHQKNYCKFIFFYFYDIKLYFSLLFKLPTKSKEVIYMLRSFTRGFFRKTLLHRYISKSLEDNTG